MKWLKYNVDEYHTYENFTNCEFAVLERPEGEEKFKLAYVVEDEETTGRGKH